MKKSIQFFALIAVLIIGQSCGSKTKENTTDSDATVASDVAADQTKKEEAAAARRAEIAKSRAETEARRKAMAEETAKKSPFYKDASGKVIYNVVETQPIYTGGKEAMEKYLSDNLKYPETAKEKGVEGTVFVDFVVGDNGKVRDVVATDVIGDVDQSLKDEAIRVVSAMPTWVAGRQNGKNVDAKFSIPITYELSLSN